MTERTIIKLQRKDIPFSYPNGSAQAIIMHTYLIKTPHNANEFHVLLESISPEIPSNILGENVFQFFLNRLFQNELSQVNPIYCQLYFRYPWTKDCEIEIHKIYCNQTAGNKDPRLEFDSHRIRNQEIQNFESVFGAQKNKMNN